MPFKPYDENLTAEYDSFLEDRALEREEEAEEREREAEKKQEKERLEKLGKYTISVTDWNGKVVKVNDFEADNDEEADFKFNEYALEMTTNEIDIFHPRIPEIREIGEYEYTLLFNSDEGPSFLSTLTTNDIIETYLKEGEDYVGETDRA